MIVLETLSQTGSNTIVKDSLTCYTPTQLKQIAKGLVENTFCKEQLELLREATEKQQELIESQKEERATLVVENEKQKTKIDKLSKNRKWWFGSGVTAGFLLTILILSI